MSWRAVAVPGLAGPHGGATRPVVLGRDGGVACGHWLGSLAGVDVLREGGNAFDAAIAAAAVVTVAEPYMSGIGGVGAAVCHEAASGTTVALDFHGAAPAAAHPHRWRSVDDFIDGFSGAMTPAVVAGWAALHERFGSRPFDRLVAPAIEHARRGVAVSPFCHFMIAARAEQIARDAGARHLLMRGGVPLAAGDVLVQPQLADTLAQIASDGPRAFYEGPVAAAIARACADADGLLTTDDLARVRARWLPVLSAAYRSRTLSTLPPPFGSVQVLETLRLLEAFDLGTLPHHGPDHLHLLIEAMKLAGADRIRGLSRPDFDARALLDEEHVVARRRAIDSRRAARGGGERYQPAAENTTHLVTADRWGNLVSLTQTLGWHFGGGAVLGETGIFLNNMGYWFDLDPKSPNVIGPGKAQSSPIAPIIVADADGRPWMSMGTPGGFGILQTSVQMLSNVIDFRFNPQAALEAPRVRAIDGTDVMAETRIAAATRDALSARGHTWQLVDEWAYRINSLGRGQMVVRDADRNVVYAASDPRCDGYALAY